MDESQALRRRLVDRFVGEAADLPMWERMANAVGIQDPRAWQWIDGFLTTAPAVMLFDAAEEPSLIRFEHGSQVVPVLASATGFEFYVTDESADYLLAYNHHDFLLADGSAKKWLLSLTSSREHTDSQEVGGTDQRG